MTSIGFFPGRAGNTNCVCRFTVNTDSAVLNCSPQNTLEFTEIKPVEVYQENRLLFFILISAANVMIFPVLCSITEMLFFNIFTPSNTGCRSQVPFLSLVSFWCAQYDLFQSHSDHQGNLKKWHQYWIILSVLPSSLLKPLFCRRDCLITDNTFNNSMVRLLLSSIPFCLSQIHNKQPPKHSEKWTKTWLF